MGISLFGGLLLKGTNTTVHHIKPKSKISLHRLMQAIVREFINHPSQQNICLPKTEIKLQLAECVNALCPSVSNALIKDWYKAKTMMPHIETILANIQETDSPLVAELQNKIGEYARRVLGLYTKAHVHYQKALAMWQRLYPHQLHPQIATSLNNVGVTYIYLGGKYNEQKGLLLLEQSLEMLQTLYSDQLNSELATAFNNLGSSYVKLGGVANIKKGLIALEKALVIRQTFYPNQPHITVAQSLNGVGNAYTQLNGLDNIKVGLILLKQSLAMWKTLSPNQSHPWLSFALDNTGAAYIKLGSMENIKKG